MSVDDKTGPESAPTEQKSDETRMRGRNRALGLALFGLVIFIFVVSYFKIEVAAG